MPWSIRTTLKFTSCLGTEIAKQNIEHLLIENGSLNDASLMKLRLLLNYGNYMDLNINQLESCSQKFLNQSNRNTFPIGMEMHAMLFDTFPLKWRSCPHIRVKWIRSFMSRFVYTTEWDDNSVSSTKDLKLCQQYFVMFPKLVVNYRDYHFKQHGNVMGFLMKSALFYFPYGI